MRSLSGLTMLLVVASTVQAAEEPIEYLRDIKPVLRERCYACHGALKQEGGLRLDSAALALQGGDSGAAVVAGDRDGSPLAERITATDDSYRMPPEGKPLAPDEIERILRWIDGGAPAPEDEQPEQDPRQHWAFSKPIRPMVPPAAHNAADEEPDVELNAIDRFIQEKRQAAGLKPLPPADRATLLRRVYLDLIGLPPTAEQLETFLQDSSPLAYQRVVEQLLESPHYGERWGRHWMDVWRYSDWYGRRSVPDVMNSYPMVWRWRDWIVRSLNEDKPYDRMIVEMLAADEIAPDDQQNVVATGYLVRSWFKWNYETWKKDLVEHTGKAFLGLTLNCAQCHDHKYDPISQEEYFRFRAFFEPLELRHDRVPGEADPGPFVKYVYGQPYGPISSGMVRVFDEYLDAETFMFAKGDARLRMEGKPPMTAAAPEVLGGRDLQVAPIVLPITAAYPGMKEFIRDEERAKKVAELRAAEQEVSQWRAELETQPVELRNELEEAERALDESRAVAASRGATQTPPTTKHVLSGTQSLMLDASTGRRALAHALPGLDTLADGGMVSYLIEVVQDGHTNLQLALDIGQGATGGFVAFEQGNIKTYSPGGFNEFVAASYDPAQGQTRFRVEMQLDLAHDQFFLTVTSLADERVLVERAAAALNGFKPRADGKRGLFLDCRPGSQAVYDDLRFAQPDGTSVVQFDFEPSAYSAGVDITQAALSSGDARWTATSYCQPPATSLVRSAIEQDPDVQLALARRATASSALRVPLANVAAAEARRTAAQRQLESLEARIAADAARYSTGLLSEDRHADPAVRALIDAACHSERAAAVAGAQAASAKAEAALAAAEQQVADAANGTDQPAKVAAQQALQAAQKMQADATTALGAAETALAQPAGEYTPLSPKYAQSTSGRRTVLADWIASKDNPLTARVAVNHLWLRHFGQALVETTHDFGRNGSRPTHPQLLDWLACELMDHGWSMKHMHRLMVTSQTYRLASAVPASLPQDAAAIAAASAADPENSTYWRFPASRMQAEVVRDSLLSVSGQLDRTMGGHELDHKLGLTSPRRSIYFAHHGEEKMEFLELFDAANACDCYKRTTSVQPQQALALTNSELTKVLSRKLADRLWTETNGQSPAFVDRAFLQVLNRPPRDPERTASLDFLEQQATRLDAAQPDSAAVEHQQRARANLIHALMNHNDFVTIR